MYKEPNGARFIFVSNGVAQELSQNQFLKLLNLSSIKYKVSMINHLSILHLNSYGL